MTLAFKVKLAFELLSFVISCGHDNFLTILNLLLTLTVKVKLAFRHNNFIEKFNFFSYTFKLKLCIDHLPDQKEEVGVGVGGRHLLFIMV